MALSALSAISPIDGRYRSKVEALGNYFSEEALIKYRVLVEIEYFIALCETPLPQLESISNSVFEDLRDIYKNFTSVAIPGLVGAALEARLLRRKDHHLREGAAIKS